MAEQGSGKGQAVGGQRAGAIARAQKYVDDGTFEADLGRRVAIRTESQALAAIAAGA